jgi:hypothetical protein
LQPSVACLQNRLPYSCVEACSRVSFIPLALPVPTASDPQEPSPPGTIGIGLAGRHSRQVILPHVPVNGCYDRHF